MFQKIKSLFRGGKEQNNQTGNKQDDETEHLEHQWISPEKDNTSNQVQNIDAYPYNCIGMVVAEFDGHETQLGLGTGFLIDPFYVLTVAHNVYHINSKKFGRKVRFVLGNRMTSQDEILNQQKQSQLNQQFHQLISENQLPTHQVDEYIVHPSYLKSKSLKEGKCFDTALLKLKTPVRLKKYIQYTTPFYRLIFRLNFSQGVEILLSGYPAKKVRIINDRVFKGDQYQSKIKISHFQDLDKNLIKYMDTTWGGQSGSPLLLKYEDQIIAVGLHQGFSELESRNSGILLTHMNMLYLITWMFQKRKEIGLSLQSVLIKQNKKQKIQYPSASSPIARRIKRQLLDIQKNPIDNVSVRLVDDNIFHWQGIIIGSKQTPYAGGIFLLNIQVRGNYPYSSPYINFLTKVYHPNIDSKGNISLDILDEKWSPALTVQKALLSILSFLDNPNVDDSLVPKIAEIYKNNRAQYNATAKEWTKKYARDA